MPLTLSNTQQKILLHQIGRADDATLQNLIPDLVTESESEALGDGRLLRLIVKRELIDVLLGGAWGEVTFKEGDEQTNDSDRSKHLNQMREAVEAEIQKVRDGLSSSVVEAGQLETTSTVPAPSCGPDPSDRAYAGDPVRASRWR